MLKFLLIVGLTLLGSCSSKKADLKAKQANLYFSAGTQSLIDKDYTAALTSLMKANEFNPESTEILTNLGMAYYFKGEQEIAIKHLMQALKINPKNSDARVNLASIHYKDGKYAEAEKLYKEVLQDLTYDKQARTLYNLGLIELQSRKNSAGAEAYFKRSVKEDENYCPAFFQLGMVQYNRRQFNTALKNFKEAGTGTCYESPAPHYYTGLTLVELGKLDSARMKFDEVESRFKKTSYATKSRAKALELNSIEFRQQQKPQGHASRNSVLESPEF
ncbi:MAG TPA: tetratricopeptide repeat protein [Bacteriovoracaceae bacterium]|nr:tetratricopeptide repeat protein [Bacteriovoracaceae bacterium]